MVMDRSQSDNTNQVVWQVRDPELWPEAGENTFDKLRTFANKYVDIRRSHGFLPWSEDYEYNYLYS